MHHLGDPEHLMSACHRHLTARSLLGVIIAGFSVASTLLMAPSANAAEEGITSFALASPAQSVVTVGPHGGQSILPTVHMVMTLPWATANVHSIIVAGFREPDATSQASGVGMQFQPTCHVTADCYQAGNQLTVTFKLKLTGYSGTYFGSNVAPALEHPGTFALQPSVHLRSGMAISYTGPPLTVRFLRATKIAQFNASPEPIRRRSSVRTTGVVWKATACVEGSRVPRCHDELGRWTPVKGRRVAIYFDPTGPAPARLVGTAKTDLLGRFTRSLRQNVTGVWHAKLISTASFGPSRSAGDRLRVRR